MPLDIRLDGETIATVDEQVLRVSLQTARGTVAGAGLAPTDGVVDLLLERVAPGGPPRLDQIEAASLQEMRDRQPEGTKVGYASTETEAPIAAGQGYHDETLRPGGVDKEASARPLNRPPTKDLGSGLQPGDTDTLNARINAFNEHGDADRAVKENDPGSAQARSASDTATTQTDSDDGRGPERRTASDDTTQKVGSPQDRGPANDPPSTPPPNEANAAATEPGSGGTQTASTGASGAPTKAASPTKKAGLKLDNDKS